MTNRRCPKCRSSIRVTRSRRICLNPQCCWKGAQADEPERREKRNFSDDELLWFWQCAEGPEAKLSGPLIQFAGLVYRAALDAAEQRGAARGWQPIDSTAHHSTVPRLVLVRESAYPNGRMAFAYLSDGVWRECGVGLPVFATHWCDVQVPAGLQAPATQFANPNHDPDECGCENHAPWCPFNPNATEVAPYPLPSPPQAASSTEEGS